MVGVSCGSRLTRTLVVGVALAGLLASPAAPRPGEVEPVSIVMESGKPVMRPAVVKVADGDTIKICNRSSVIAQLFSYSKHNVFGRKTGAGVPVARGACFSVVVHNPTGTNLLVQIRSEIQNSIVLRVNVSPASPAFNLTGTWHGTDGSTFVIKQTGDTVTWAAHSADNRAWANDFTGHIDGKLVIGSWKDRETHQIHQTGQLTFRIDDKNHLNYVKSSVPWGTCCLVRGAG